LLSTAFAKIVSKTIQNISNTPRKSRAKANKTLPQEKDEEDDDDGDDERRSLLLCTCMYLIAVWVYTNWTG
jgi:hypothetical protein